MLAFAVTELLNEQELLACSGEDLKSNGGVHVLFSAHGVPESYVTAGDPYKGHICCCVNQIANSVIFQLHSALKDQLRNTEDRLPTSSTRNRNDHQFLRSLKFTDLLGRARTTTALVQQRMQHHPGGDDSIKGCRRGHGTITTGVVNNAIPELMKENYRSASAEGMSNDNLHFHLSFQSRVGPVQWIR